MDKERVKGSAQQAKGKIKELAGKAVGNKKLQARGKGGGSRRKGSQCGRRPEGRDAWEVSRVMVRLANG
jgi:hypothetical protein